MPDKESHITVTPEQDAAQRAEVDRSVSLPVLFFFTSGLTWLLVSMALGLVASVKSHHPDLFGHWSWLQYGRMQPAHMNSFVYGWCFQAGFGVALWIMARLCRTPLAKRSTLIFAGHVWNLGVALGTVSILLGYGTSMEFMDYPKFVWPILFISYAAIAAHFGMMFKTRRDKQVFISQWYILAAAFWFPWAYLTANLLIHSMPSAAVIGTAINGWFSGTLFTLWLVPIGLAASYYLIPKIVGRPIHSYQLALASFWGIAIIGPWVGIQDYLGGPLPAWMPALSGAAAILLAIPMIVIGVNHHNTLKGNHALVQYSPTLRFVFFGAIAFNVFILLGAALSVFRSFQFTHAETAYRMVGLYAFFTMTMFGAIYYIMPRLVGCEWIAGSWIRLHFWLSAYGCGAMVLCLFLGGLLQGQQAHEYNQPFSTSFEATKGFLVGFSITWLLILLSNFLFLLHMLLMLLRLGPHTPEPTLIHPMHEEYLAKAQSAKA